MERPKTREDVAVFVDFENVYVSVREKFDAQPNFELIMDRCEDYGRIVIARAYADWYRYPRVTSALFANGVEPMYVPTYYYDREVGRTGRPIKNSVDIHLCIDAMRTLYTQTHIDKFVLVTGDRDFIPLVNAIRQHGKEVIIIGIGGAASAHLAQSGDEFLFYEQIADIKPPQQQRQEQQRQEQQRREREKPEREKPEREKSERGDGNGKVESRREREKPERERPERERPERERPAPVEVEAEVSAPERSFFDTLVDAINLARQRGFVSNLGSLKVLMRELDSSFNESKVKDINGKPFTKFKDFVKDAERQGKVQIFTNGTVTEVFLPGEDPLHVSQFAEDLASDQVERELEHELEQQEAAAAPAPEASVSAAELPALIEDAEQPALPGLPDELIDIGVADTPAFAETDAFAEMDATATPESTTTPTAVPAESEAVRPTFGEREWQIFRGSMSQFSDPVRFAEIFSALRGLRNQEVFDLTNNELKELVKQAINRGMLQRTGRGARAYYRISTQYRVAQDEAPSPLASAERAASEAAAETVDRGPGAAAPTEQSAAGLVSDAGLAPAVERRRRGRAYDVAMLSTATETAPSESAAPEPTAETSPPIADTVAEQMAVQMADAGPAKPRRNRRKKPVTATPEAEAAPAPAEAAPEPEPPAQLAEPEAAADADGDPDKAAGTKKRRTRRKKATPKAEDEGAPGESSGE